jgi:hypothetical protein
LPVRPNLGDGGSRLGFEQLGKLRKGFANAKAVRPTERERASQSPPLLLLKIGVVTNYVISRSLLKSSPVDQRVRIPNAFGALTSGASAVSYVVLTLTSGASAVSYVVLTLTSGASAVSCVVLMCTRVCVL